MCRESFALRQNRDRVRNRVERARRVTQRARAFHEIVNTERGRETRGAPRRQHVVWTSDIIAGGFGRVRAEEDRARVRKPRGNGRSEEHTSELQSLAYLVCRL